MEEGRRYLGIEKSEKYARLSRTRLEEATAQDDREGEDVNGANHPLDAGSPGDVAVIEK
jgi:hypothetical protein